MVKPRARPTRPVRGASPAGADAERLARRVQREHPELSFSRAKSFIEEGKVRVGGEVERDPGAWIPPATAIDLDPGLPRHGGEGRVDLVHLDADLVVVAKPAGLLSVPTTLGEERETLVSRLQKELRRRGGASFVAVVHRLDRDTSGLLAFARNLAAQHALQEQLLDHSLGRVYDAVVEGDLAAEAGTFDWPLVGDGVRRRRWVAGAGEEGKWAVTHYRVLERFGIATLVEVRLETGRTHQIRIHFSAAGHPVLGDAVYRPREAGPFPVPVERLALHAGALQLRHPRDGRELRFTAPRPDDFAALVTRLRARPGRSIDRSA